MSAPVSPLMIAHRGERILSPENTIRACRLALEQGATALEVDVRVCRTGEIVVLHDAFLKKLFGKWKATALASLEELRSLSFNQLSYRYSGQVCTLDELLEEFKGVAPINLDAKTFSPFNTMFARALVQTVQRFNMQDQIWISSFNPVLLRQIKQLKSTIRTGYLFQDPQHLHKFLDIFLSSDAWHPHYRIVSDRFIARARQLKKELYVWTVNDESVLQRMIGYGFNGIITDIFFRRAAREEVPPLNKKRRPLPTRKL